MYFYGIASSIKLNLCTIMVFPNALRFIYLLWHMYRPLISNTCTVNELPILGGAALIAVYSTIYL